MVIHAEPLPVEAVPAEPGGEPQSPAPRSGPPLPGALTIVLSAVMLAGAVAVFFGIFAYGLSGLQEQRSQHQLYAAFRGLLDPASEVAPSVGGHIPDGTPVALLNAPRAGIHDVVVVEGTSSGDLLAGPGHLPDTPLPGQVGESMIVGKSTTAGAPFSDIAHLRPGDVVTVRTGQGKFRYVVRGQLAAGQRPPPVRSDGGTLVLATSAAGTGGLAGIEPSGLVYVDATLHGQAVAAPRRQPRTVPAADLPGHGDPGAWPLLLLWSVGLLAGTVATWWLWARWGLLRTWLIGAPVLLALLWGFSDQAMRFLPNVY